MIGSQIFLPNEVQVWGGTDMQHLKVIGSITTGPQKKGDPDILQPLVCKLHENAPISCIKFVAKPIYKLPTWHPGYGDEAFIFIDEIEIR